MIPTTTERERLRKALRVLPCPKHETALWASTNAGGCDACADKVLAALRPEPQPDGERVEAAIERARQALHCLYLEAPDAVVRDLTAIVEAAFTALREPVAPAPETDLPLDVRRQLWLTHGCSLAGLYGDDGCMDCSQHRPPIDFRNGSWERIKRGIDEHCKARASQVAQAPAVAPREPSEAMPSHPPDDDKARLIAEGATMSLREAVREILLAVDDMLTPTKRAANAHGGAYLSRWHWERLRAAYRAAPPSGEPPTGSGEG